MYVLLLACAAEGGPGTLVTTPDGWYLPFGAADTDEGWGIDQLEGGDLIIATHQAAPRVLPDIYLYRISTDGEVLWERPYGDGDSELAYVVETDGNIAYAGGSRFSGLGTETADALLLALDAETGWVEWDWSYDGGFGYEEIDGIVAEGQDLYLSGWTTTELGNDMLLAKLDSAGNEIWISSWGGSRWDEANGHLVADESSLYVAGLIDGDSYAQGGDALVAAFSKQDGSPLWQARLGEEAGLWDDALGLTLYEGRLYAVGSAAGSSYDLKIWCLETDGTIVWEQSFAGSGAESGRSLVANSSGLWVGLNSSSEGAGEVDMGILKLGLDGSNPVRTLLWGGVGHEEVHDLVLSNGSAFLIGQTSSLGEGKEDAVLIRANAATEQAITVP